MKQISLILSTFSFAAANIVAPTLVPGTSPVLAQTAGCGSGWSNIIINRAAPAMGITGANIAIAGRQFRVACDEHDACYDTYGKSKQDCEKAFHNRMLGICARDHNTIAARLSGIRGACNARADAFYTAVTNFGSDAYSKAQAAAKPSFSWSQAGAISGLVCTRIHEDTDPHAWSDNFLCTSRDIGMRWSQAGAIGGMKCTRIHEDADPHAWGDNFLCVPQSSPINFRWSQAKAIGGMTCLRVHEDADPHAWSDNFLCW